MEFSTVLTALVETCALFGPFLPPIVGLYWLDKILRWWDAWDAHRDEIIAYLIGGLAMVYLSIDYSVGVIRTSEPSLIQVFALFVAVCSILVLLDGIYQRVRTFIKTRRTSN